MKNYSTLMPLGGQQGVGTSLDFWEVAEEEKLRTICPQEPEEYRWGKLRS
jgi:hypothetical protein